VTITLPRKVVKSETKNPRKLLIYADPKRGKTTLIAGLPNGLILDLDRGSGFLDAIKIQANNLDELIDVGKAIKQQNEKEGKPIYDFISIDTVSKLEEFSWELAVRNYKESLVGRNFDGDANKLKQLPKGAGYPYMWEAFDRIYTFFSILTPHLILVAHLKRNLISKEGSSEEIEVKDIELTGKLRVTTCADMDAIGMLKRKENKTILSFKTSPDDLICGARPEHLRDQEIVVAEYTDGKFIYHWDKIFT